MSHRFLILLAISFFRFAQPLFAQTDPCMHRIVPVSVLSSDGRLVAGLQADNFRASLRGTPVQILSVTPDSKPRRVIIVLDASGSMHTPTPLWHLYIALTQDFVTNLPDRTMIGLVVFATELNTALPLSYDRRIVQRELSTLDAEPVDQRKAQTSLYDSVRRAAQMFDIPEEGDAIFAVTDGGNNFGKSNQRIVETELVSRGIRLFSLLIGYPVHDITPEERLGPTEFEELVTNTGGFGAVVSGDSLDEKSPIIDKSGRTTLAARVVGRQAQLISNFYRMEIEIATPIKGFPGWKLELTSTNNHKSTLLYPQKFSGCTSPPPAH